ncbi:MAG TPA: prepilin-type N-terminal cleavage/methylation domain-containing protein [Candidatus Binatia bacterium]|jgi:prepilin-type N-terminal cleavage/methylation domain-containing protein
MQRGNPGGLRTLRNPCGFTLNEILVSMSVVAVAVLGYFLTTLNLIHGTKAADGYTAALNLAHDKMEELKARTRMADENRCPDSGEHGLTVSGSRGGGFDRCWRIAGTELGPNLKQIDVIVSWRDTDRRELTLSTLVYSSEG